MQRLAASSREAKDAVDEVVAAFRTPVREIDAAKLVDEKIHGAGENASALIAACVLADHRMLERSGREIVGVTGNSLGFYTALGAAGALSLADTGRLVEEMAALQAAHGTGGQLIAPAVGDDWRPDPARDSALSGAVERGDAWLSVDLGSFRVLGARDAGALARSLPAMPHGGREYPLVLPGHAAFHTPLADGVAAAVREGWTLGWRAPRRHLVLGNGALVTPWSADPAALATYTLREQVVTPLRLAAAVRVGLRELAPEVIVLAGPGESIGGSLGAGILAEGWRGLRDRDAFKERQAADPVLIATARAEQRARLVVRQ